MLLREELIQYLSKYLNSDNIEDYCLNGLQIEGNPIIKSIVTGVSLSQDLINIAIKIGADTILVHHGIFWKNEKKQIIGIKKKRIKNLLSHNINLISYHIPLDIHQEIGNNIELAKHCGWSIIKNFNTGTQFSLGILGKIPPTELKMFTKDLSNKINQKINFIQGNNYLVENLSWCTGAGQDFIEYAALSGSDTFLSGEVSERTYYLAKELKINYIIAGHYATEKYGIQSLGNHLKEKFLKKISIQFIDIPNPI